MGYYTDYEITLHHSRKYDPELEDNVAADLQNISGYSFSSDLCIDEVKWYDHHEDMKQLSKLYPDIRFTVTGYGEERTDSWRAFYLDGKSHTVSAKVTFEDFDPEKLN